MNILYIEDNEADKLLVRTILKSINPSYNVYIFPDGPSALGFLNSMKSRSNALSIDLILLDFALPKMNGADILQIIKSDLYLRNIPVVGLSGSVPIKEEFRNLGAVGFIEKKLDLQELEFEIRNVLSMIAGMSIKSR